MKQKMKLAERLLQLVEFEAKDISDDHKKVLKSVVKDLSSVLKGALRKLDTDWPGIDLYVDVDEHDGSAELSLFGASDVFSVRLDCNEARAKRYFFTEGCTASFVLYEDDLAKVKDVETLMKRTGADEVTVSGTSGPPIVTGLWKDPNAFAKAVKEIVSGLIK